MTKILVFVIFCSIFCGVLSTNDDRIVGGRPAEEGEFPYQVSLRRSYNGKHFCGGTVISPTHILTAAHCMYYIWGGVLPPIVVQVVAGQNNLTLTSHSIIRNVSKLHIHEEFNNYYKKNDIAIVELETSLPFGTEDVAIAALRSSKVKDDTKCTVSGWGVQEFGSQIVSEELLAAEVNVINFELCQKLYGVENVTLFPGMMCAGLADGSKDACQGDSGGPLFCDGFLTGIVSTALGCANAEFPGIYTEVSEYTEWITNIVFKRRF